MKIVIPNNEQQLEGQIKQIIQTAAPALLKTEGFKILLPKTDASTESFKSEPVKYNQTDIKSYLGTNVFSNLNIKYRTKGEGTTQVKRLMIDTALFVVTQTKNVVTTAIQGRDGTVKEYISLGDYKVSIKGVIAGYPGTYPQSKVQGKYNSPVADLIDACNDNRAVDVESWYLTMFGIYKLVITDFTIGQNEGEFSLQPFEISALSDTPFQLDITK
jgi:hypothetical protein